MVSKLDSLYYNQELKMLVEEGRRFAERHPEIARYLNLHGAQAGARDPHAERIVEAFAFLTGKLQRYLDAQFPELVQALFELLYPDYVRPLPCKTLVQFTPDESMLDKPLQIAAGTELYADDVGPDGETYTFTTCRDLWVQPVDLAKVYVDPEAAGDYTLSMVLRLHPGASAQACAWDLVDFTLTGEPSVCQELFLQLSERLSGIAIKGAPGSSIELDWQGFKPESRYGHAADPRYAPLQDLRDYFDEPQRFMTFRLPGLDKRIKGMGEVSELQIDFRFAKPFATGVHVQTEHLKLHCVMAQNLFKAHCEPFKTDAVSLQYPLSPDMTRDDLEVWSVIDVYASVGQERDEVRPYFRFEQGDLDRERQWFYTLRRDPAPDRGWLSFIRFLDLKHEGPGAIADRTMSVSAWCSNRHLAQNLRLNQLDRVSNDVPEIIRVTNLTHTSDAAWPALYGNEDWDFLAHLALDFVELGRHDAFTTLLRLYHLNRSEAGKRKIKGVTRVERHKDYAIVRGCCIQGQRLEIDVDGNFFASIGDVALFTRALVGFLESYCPINGFIKLVVSETETREVFTHVAWG